MNVVPWLLAGALALAVLVLWIKLRLLRQSADEICRAFAQRLADDTNTLIDISTRDRHMRALAAQINRQLRVLRAQRQRFQQGDCELKTAVTNVSHDLRTPLTAISGYLELLEREEKSPEAGRYLAVIRERAETLKAMTEELFRFSVVSATAGELHCEALSLNGVLEESLAGFYAALTQRGITPVITLPETPVVRCLDRDALRRIYDNLLGNALKYSDGDLRVTLTRDGATVFTNAAAALDAVSAQRLFDRFYTVESGRDSTGLGLSIARLLTERLHGELTAACAQGELSLRLFFPE